MPLTPSCQSRVGVKWRYAALVPLKLVLNVYHEAEAQGREVKQWSGVPAARLRPCQLQHSDTSRNEGICSLISLQNVVGAAVSVSSMAVHPRTYI